MAAELQQLPRIARPAGLPLAMCGAMLVAMVGVLLTAGAALAQTVVLSGRMGERALLVVDGLPYAVNIGQTVAGVKLLRWNGDVAEVERAGQTLPLRLGASPAQLGAAARGTSP